MHDNSRAEKNVSGIFFSCSRVNQSHPNFQYRTQVQPLNEDTMLHLRLICYQEYCIKGSDVKKSKYVGVAGEW